MSEIEINEDNCVLNQFELELIGDIFKKTLRNNGECELKDSAKNFLNMMFLKITKLNDMAKEQER